MTTARHHSPVAIPAGGEPAAHAFYGDLRGLEEGTKPANLSVRGGVLTDAS